MNSEKVYVIRFLLNGDGRETTFTGKLLKDADFEAMEGRGTFKVTEDLAEARLFESPANALEFYQTQSKTVPLRDDGKPNRPLTSYTVEVSAVTL